MWGDGGRSRACLVHEGMDMPNTNLSKPRVCRRPEEKLTAEDFEPLKDEPLDRPVDLDAELDMCVARGDWGERAPHVVRPVPGKKGDSTSCPDMANGEAARNPGHRSNPDIVVADQNVGRE